MKYVKSFRANNISDLDESEIRDKEFLHQYTEFDEAGHPVEAITYTPDGTVEHKYKYQYNAEGKVTDELLIEEDDEVTEHRSMEYNAEGQLVKEFIHYLDGTADVLHYTYDKEGRLISRRSIDSEGETGNYMVNVYDGEHLVSETEYDIAGEIITQRKIIYNEEGQITEEVFKTPEENYDILYSYDEQGVASVRRRYNEDKHLMERNTYTYDSEGRLSESMDETSSGIEITYTTYDAAGNIMLQEEKSEAGDLLSSIERTYDESKRPITTTVFTHRPGQQIPQHYRIRIEYES
jgi:YD repeat-containing protein